MPFLLLRVPVTGDLQLYGEACSISPINSSNSSSPGSRGDHMCQASHILEAPPASGWLPTCQKDVAHLGLKRSMLVLLVNAKCLNKKDPSRKGFKKLLESLRNMLPFKLGSTEMWNPSSTHLSPHPIKYTTHGRLKRMDGSKTSYSTA